MVIHLFGDKLRELRKNKKMSQEDLGELCGVAKQTISSWENNASQPSIEIIKKIADYFGVTTDYLLDFNQDDANTLTRLKTALKEAGMWDDNIDDMNLEDFAKSIKIMNMLNDDKDTDK